MDDGTDGVEFARALIQRQAQRKAPQELGTALGKARGWERHAGRTQESGFQTAQQATEWQRITDLVRIQGWPAYDAARLPNCLEPLLLASVTGEPVQGVARCVRVLARELGYRAG